MTDGSYVRVREQFSTPDESHPVLVAGVSEVRAPMKNNRR